MRDPLDVIGNAARSAEAGRYGIGLTVLKALRDEYGFIYQYRTDDPLVSVATSRHRVIPVPDAAEGQTDA